MNINTTEEFFTEMCNKYLANCMLRYIDMTNFRDDFITQIDYVIEYTREALIKYNADSISEFDDKVYKKIEDFIQNIPFWFNEPSESYYISIYKFVEKMAKN